jgi:Flp pilus assembly protein TadD
MEERTVSRWSTLAPRPARRPASRRAPAFALAFVLCSALAACSTAPRAPALEPYLRDDLFARPTQPIDPKEVFALNDAMRHYVHFEISRDLRLQGPMDGLVDALYRKDRLKLSYDSGATRNAREAFEARKGNCLSLVLMTAAFAKELNLPVYYQLVQTDEMWSRNGDLLFLNAHVNVTLGIRATDSVERFDALHAYTIDFLPSEDSSGRRERDISEATVIAMYMNNRAAEALADGQFDQAYAWARAAAMQAPDFTAAYNTLAVIYLRHGDLEPARVVLSGLLDRYPTDRTILSNMLVVLGKLGRTAEASALGQKLADLEPYPPFHFFRLGTEAMQRGDYEEARSQFRREVDRADYNSEFHYWLGLAELRLGEVSAARRQIAIALENSTSDHEHDLYAAKLARLRSREAP